MQLSKPGWGKTGAELPEKVWTENAKEMPLQLKGKIYTWSVGQ